MKKGTRSQLGMQTTMGLCKKNYCSSKKPQAVGVIFYICALKNDRTFSRLLLEFWRKEERAFQVKYLIFANTKGSRNSCCVYEIETIWNSGYRMPSRVRWLFQIMELSEHLSHIANTWKTWSPPKRRWLTELYIFVHAAYILTLSYKLQIHLLDLSLQIDERTIFISDFKNLEDVQRGAFWF